MLTNAICRFSIVFLFISFMKARSEIAEIRYNLFEEVPIGTQVGNLLLDSDLMKELPADIIDTISFRFLRHSHNVVASSDQRSPEGFSLATSTGVIRTSARLDRDELCPGMVECLLRIDVVVQPVAYFRILRVVILIEDINDNYPVFPTPEVTMDVLESSNVGATFAIPSATDLDSPEYSIKKYRIVPNSEVVRNAEDVNWSHSLQQNHYISQTMQKNIHQFPFHLRETLKPGGEKITEVRLVLTKSLDRETVSYYEAVVEASDSDDWRNESTLVSGDTSLTSVMLVRINVIDVNDNIPVFERESYVAKIREDIASGSFIIGVKAHDRDAGLNGKVIYEFTSLTENSHGSEFFINNTTGEISTRKRLDFEAVSHYRLTVVAQDRGPDPAPVTVPVTIIVEDVNDNAPVISIETLSFHLGVAEVVESFPAGTFVAHVSVADADSGENGKFECSLKLEGSETEEIDCFALKVILDNEFQIVTTRPLDREERSSYRLHIECRDMPTAPGNSVMIGRTGVTVNIGDVNDNDPEFDRPLYVAEVIENNYITAFILQVNAVDRDTGRNSHLQYSLEDAKGYSYGGINSIESLLSIEPNTGIIRASISFDRETSEEVRFIVIATDNGHIPRSSSVDAKIIITDVNDEKPDFEQISYEFGVRENEPAGTVIGQVLAIDADAGENGQVYYDIESLPGSPYPILSKSDNFAIDKQTGMITTTHSLDREEISVYKLVVKAFDSSAVQSSSVRVNIFVQDVNDNYPAFNTRLLSNKTFQVSTASPVGFLVTQVVASDADIGQNGHLTYGLQPQNEWFSVDAETGAIYVVKPLHNKHDTCHDIIVKASDAGIPPLMSLVNLVICVNNSVTLDDSSGRFSSRGKFLPHQNLTVVIVLAVVSSIITVALICAIYVLKKQENMQKRDCNCRQDLMVNDNSCLQLETKSSITDVNFTNVDRNFKNRTHEFENNSKMTSPNTKNCSNPDESHVSYSNYSAN